MPVTVEPSWPLLAVIVVVSLALVGLALWLARTEERAVRTRTGAGGSGRDASGEDASEGTADTATVAAAPARPTAAVIVNPTKFPDLEPVRSEVEGVAEERGWAVRWWETTEDDPGGGQAREAVAAGVDLVCSLGGDGTVRTVGSALAGTGVPLGLLPGGTGNLLARNLELPISSVGDALTVALDGVDTPVDTCRLELVRPAPDPRGPDPDAPEGPQEDRVVFGSDADVAAPDIETAHRSAPGATEEHRFLVMAGLGFDADVMAGAPEQLKARVGWLAYLVAGAQNLKGAQFVVTVRTDQGLRLRRRVRSAVVGNVGRLQGGVALLPDAKHNDGVMDFVLLSPQGLAGWGAVAVRIASGRRRGHQRVGHYTAAQLDIRTDRPVEMQLDGDSLGPVQRMTISIDPGSLLVRLPAVHSSTDPDGGDGG